MGNVNFHWPHEGWAQILAPRYVQSVGCSSWAQPCLRSPTVLQTCLFHLPSYPGAPSPFLLLSLPPLKYPPSRVLSSSPKYISQANSFRSVVLLFFSFFDPPWVASPGFSIPQERGKGIWNQLVPMLRLLVHNYSIPPWNQESSTMLSLLCLCHL